MTENIVYVGNKPPMNYVLAIMRFFNADADAVVLKARGRAISRAVDVAEIARRRFLTEVQDPKIEIGSEQMEAAEGGTRGVSTISITMTREKESKKEAPPTKHPVISDIKGVGEARAEKLRKSGFDTVESLAKAKPEKLSKLSGISEKVSGNLIASAKELLKKT